MDDFCTAVAFRLGLLGDGAHHIFRELDGSDLDVADLDSPGFRLGIEDALDVSAELLSVRSISSSSCWPRTARKVV